MRSDLAGGSGIGGITFLEVKGEGFKWEQIPRWAVGGGI